MLDTYKYFTKMEHSKDTRYLFLFPNILRAALSVVAVAAVITRARL
jgi:hypothetical protein